MIFKISKTEMLHLYNFEDSFIGLLIIVIFLQFIWLYGFAFMTNSDIHYKFEGLGYKERIKSLM